ncbi:alcohol dehydrogenase catalytic domain-containing protein, partial [Streptomyces sp. SID10116]|nr:alcohol dehydrogenase catalytic domain-containing protein [Streptomyces sp. SID10116]
MRAVSPRAWGAPENLVPVEVDRPEPGLTEILVRVHAAGVNPVDWKTRAEGAFGSWGDTPILGYDVSGVVEQVGPGVTLYQPGDAVFGMPRFPEQTGGYAEFVAAPARRFAPKPAGLSHVEAAALPLAALTAWQGLIETAGL